MTATLLTFLPTLAAITAILAIVYASLMVRARAMRGLAARWGFTYIGPTTVKWLGIPRIRPHVPAPLHWHPANELRQIWNVIEGSEGGTRIFIFDGLVGNLTIRGYQYCTFIACETERSPLGAEIQLGFAFFRECLAQSHGWTVLYNVPLFTLVTWGLSARRLNYHLNKLRPTSGSTLNGGVHDAV